ncbi:helix-turn-helix transcriptional regulator [Nocardia puris]|uniref:helix-turn-helix domain-containing protein n=1 Tax=Nocardia puris TaxID=208602 RepID=UPI001894E44F|nr:helix-turn-helix transcriptional regulator [Nocardia puris]MBF6460206.1 helix-turn-helix transcriptional regulator [Nocardia puris]
MTETDAHDSQWALGVRMQEARHALGLSKRRAADIAGISETRWRHLESGVELIRGEPYPVRTTEETVTRVARALQLPPADLLACAGLRLGGESDPPAGVGHEHVDVSGLSADDVEKVRAFVAFLKTGQRNS